MLVPHVYCTNVCVVSRCYYIGAVQVPNCRIVFQVGELRVKKDGKPFVAG